MRAGLARAGLMLPLALALGACSSGGLGALIAPAPLETYDLSSPQPSGQIARGRTISIAEAIASRALDTDRILVKPKANEINYLAGAQWADRLPRLVQSRIVTTFEKGKAASSVSRPGEGIDATVRLLTEIRSFELDLSSASKVHVELTARLVGVRDGRVMAAEIFEAHVPVASSDPAVVVAGFDKAMSDVLLRLFGWVSQHR